MMERFEQTIGIDSSVRDICVISVLAALSGENVIAIRRKISLRGFAVVGLLAPAISGCAGLSDFSIKDQEWFSRPSRVFGSRSLAIETPPLSQDATVAQSDLISSDGGCPGLSAAGSPSNANALQDSGQPGAAPTQALGAVALGHSECDVARAIGSPDNVNIANNPRGDRMATITYARGPRPGIYTFTSGRLTAVERVDVPEPVARAAKPKRRAAN